MRDERCKRRTYREHNCEITTGYRIVKMRSEMGTTRTESEEAKGENPRREREREKENPGALVRIELVEESRQNGGSLGKGAQG